MANGEALFVFNSIYEPTQKDGKWVVFFKNPRTNKWEEESFVEHEKAYDHYWRKTKELQVYYNTFLREIGMKR